jgi:hypothetical protein
MANTHRIVRIDTHRPVILGRDTCNGSCETECGCVCVDPGIPAPRPPASKPEKRDHLSRFATVTALVLGIAGAMLLVHFGVQL